MESDGPKILFWGWVVKGKKIAPIVPISGSEFADFGLNCCLPVEDPQEQISYLPEIIPAEDPGP